MNPDGRFPYDEPLHRPLTWRKLGLVFAPNNEHGWIRDHAQVPTPYVLDDDRIRIYYGTRLPGNRTVTTYLDVSAADPREVLSIHDRPVLGLGELGAFDDSGAMPSCVTPYGDALALLYTGWNTSTTVPYRNAVGMALSRDGGETFTREWAGPLLDRTHDEPFFSAGPFVLPEDGRWHVWYLSCTGWNSDCGRPEPRYHIKYTQTSPAPPWRRLGMVSVDAPGEARALARPWIVRSTEIYRMWYCHRALDDYRTNPARSYRLGYAESADGVTWQRRDELVGLGLSPTGWDAEMLAYPAVCVHRRGVYLFYNGNGFGQSGFGCARLEIDGRE